MVRTIQKLLALLSTEDRRRSLLLLGMVVVMAVLDMIGVASILPFMTVLADPGMVADNRYLALIYQHFGFSSPKNFLAFLGLTVFLLLLLSTMFRAVTTYSLLRFSQMQEYAIGRRLVAGYLRQPYDWFLNQHSAEIGKTILSEVGQVTNGSLVPMMQLIAQVAVVVAIVGLLIFVNPAVAGLMIVGLGAIYAIIYLSLRRYLTRIGTARIASNRLRFQVTQETFGGIKDVKIGGLERTALKRFEGPAMSYAQHQTASLVVAQLPRYALEIIALGGMLLLAMYAMRATGGLSAALPLIALYGLAGFRLLPAFQQVYAHLTRLRFSEPALDRLHADIAALPTIENSTTAGTAEQPLIMRSNLILDCVTYKYPGAANPVLNELNLRIPVHSVVGLVGATGSGKTTAIDVMLGLLTPQSGRLLVDGHPITRANLRAWQRAVGYVPQQVFLADDTVAGNIAFGIPQDQIDLAAVARAARIANLHDFVTGQLPQGYQTQIGERGVRLSGGQRQRIGIARALYHDPEILFLDEATSALDNLTEQAVMEAVHNLVRKKTIVLIAHRLSTVRDCDTIFVLEHGRLLEQGSYEDLLRESSRFKAMASTNH
jgi:ABC-type multidrug transport system fused ATPase/permease subunit